MNDAHSPDRSAGAPRCRRIDNVIESQNDEDLPDQKSTKTTTTTMMTLMMMMTMMMKMTALSLSVSVDGGATATEAQAVVQSVVRVF